MLVVLKLFCRLTNNKLKEKKKKSRKKFEYKKCLLCSSEFLYTFHDTRMLFNLILLPLLLTTFVSCNSNLNFYKDNVARKEFFDSIKINNGQHPV